MIRRTLGATATQEPGADVDSSATREPAAETGSSATGLLALVGADTSLAGLAKALTAHGPVAAKSVPDDDLLRILITTFEANWFKAKSSLTADNWPGVAAPPHEASISLMAAMVEMRGRVWSRFVSTLQPAILEEVIRVRNSNQDFEGLESNPTDASKHFGLKDSVGSESVTSDIDLSARGDDTEIGLALINRMFPIYFKVKVEPGALFDINVYSSDWMFGGKEVSGAKGVYTLQPNEESVTGDVTPGGGLSPEGRQKKDDQNEIWSMVKTRRNMTEGEWTLFGNTMLAGIEEPGQRKDMLKKFALADSEYRTFRNDVLARVAELEAGVDYEERKQASAFADSHGHDHFEDESKEMTASNRRYEEIVLRVKALRLKIAKLKETNVDKTSPLVVEKLLLELHNEIARGLTYANEVYATQGAVLHTVYGKQGATKKLAELQAENEKDPSKGLTKDGDKITKVEYALTKEMYVQSVNENVGDTLHSLNHNADDPQYAVYRAGKYINRLCEAVVELIGATEAAKIASYKPLQKIGSTSVDEKGGKAGEDPDAVHHKTSYFSKFNAVSMLAVKSQAIELGAMSVATHKRQKAGGVG